MGSVGNNPSLGQRGVVPTEGPVSEVSRVSRFVFSDGRVLWAVPIVEGPLGLRETKTQDGRYCPVPILLSSVTDPVLSTERRIRSLRMHTY